MEIRSISSIQAQAKTMAQTHKTAESCCPYAPDSAAGQIFIAAFNASTFDGASINEAAAKDIKQAIQSPKPFATVTVSGWAQGWAK